ncbi:MAG: cbb3-type cytochrome c oxidase subunit I [Anaerolineae bacterium]|nr:cbb3-type cytochrome c oxidase subunit I [Anaerolineae bacterium]
MPRLTIWMVRTSLLHLGIGFTVGMLMFFNKGIPFDPSLWRLLPVHIEMVLLGWTMQLAMGAAFWVLPRFSERARYGNERLGWLAYVLLNTGLAIFIYGSLSSGTLLVFVGRCLELTSVFCFALMIWSRVKPLSQSAS